LTALDDDGAQADIVESLYLEQWWLHALLNNDTYHAIWRRQFFSHNYEVTAFEAILDLYVLTGNRTYYQAVINAWHMLRQGWMLPGGSLALNEGSYYPPGSYFIGFTGTAVGLVDEEERSSEREELERAGGGDDPYFHSKCMFHPGSGGSSSSYRSPLQQLRSAAERGRPHSSLPNANDPPTGELCGSVFWTFLNKRLHQLQPREEYAAEMERSIINIGISALGPPGSGGEGPNGTGIRYFANQHKQSRTRPCMPAVARGKAAACSGRCQSSCTRFRETTMTRVLCMLTFTLPVCSRFGCTGRLRPLKLTLLGPMPLKSLSCSRYRLLLHRCCLYSACQRGWLTLSPSPSTAKCFLQPECQARFSQHK
jgi:hypothetical protein